MFLVHNRRNVTQLHLPATHSALLIGKATFFRGDNNFVLLDTVPHPMGATHVLLWDLRRNETLVVGAPQLMALACALVLSFLIR